MTVAVCVRCGSMKTGVWIPGPSCGYKPEELEDRARQVLLSNHCRTMYQLEDLSLRLRHGEALAFDPADVAAQADRIMAGQRLRASRVRWRIITWCVALLVFFVAAVFVLDWLIAPPPPAVRPGPAP